MAPPTKRPKRNRGPLSSDRILNCDSPIILKDIHGFLVTCVSGWDNDYDEKEKRSIIDSLPPVYRNYTLDDHNRLLCPISIEFVHGDLFIKAAVGRFKKDVGEGYYEKSWQTKARKAMQEREEGKFIPYLREYAEELFGEKISVERTEEQEGDTEGGPSSGSGLGRTNGISRTGT